LLRLSQQAIVATDSGTTKISEATPIQVSAETLDDRAPAEIVAEENTEELYSVKNFGV
jgi:hypothetical protein